MKKLLTVLFILFSMSVFSQNAPGSNDNTNLSVGDTHFEDDTSENKEIIRSKTVRSKTFNNLKNTKNGYYLIANIFGQKQNLVRFSRSLKKRGFNTGSISYNNLNYLYLKKYNNWEDAKNAYLTNVNGTYNEDMWIMSVNNKIQKVENDGYLTIKNSANNIVTSHAIQGNTAHIALESTHATIKIDPRQKLIQRADDSFNKLWYAEAASLYEQALKGGEEYYTYDVLRKTADSYYFNTNMEKAHHWYSILYDKYKGEMSADNLFKYSHALKGMGNYAMSKRLMRLYNRKIKYNSLETEETNNAQQLQNNIVLDQLLNSVNKTGIKNLSVNSEYSEFSPMFHNSDELVFTSAKDSSFLNTRRYKWNNQPYLDLYVAKINEESQELRGATKFSKKINTKYHEASVTFSPDNNTMYFTRNNYGKKLKRDKNGINHLKIYKSVKEDGEWTEATEVSFNSDHYSTGHPALSHDGKKMYFVSDMPGSIGLTDIFVVDINEDGSFSDPKNLGPKINTERKEMFPFINNKKLYFSSDGHIGMGNLDIFEASLLEEGDGFEEPINLGSPINSEKDDFSYIVNEETQKGFFASNRGGGKGDDDIYSFKRLLPEEKEENAIAGVITDLITGDVIPEAMVVLLDENNIKLKEMQAESDGSFIFEDLESDKKYTLKTIKDTYFEEELEATTIKNQVVQTDFVLRKLKELIAVEDGIKKLKTEMIYFDFDQSYIRKDAAAELDKLVEVMTEYENMVIKIESHTDSFGADAYNKYLSDKRAKSSRDYIIAKGIDPERIESAIGYGEERLLNECSDGVSCSRVKHRLNRRSEFIIVSM